MYRNVRMHLPVKNFPAPVPLMAVTHFSKTDNYNIRSRGHVCCLGITFAYIHVRVIARDHTFLTFEIAHVESVQWQSY